MAAPDVAARHAQTRRRLAVATAREARRLWRELDPADLNGWYRRHGARLLVILGAAQLAAARQADDYLDAVLDEQGIDATASGAVNAAALAGVASDGRSLAGLVESPTITVKEAIAAGATTARAVASGAATLDMIVRTQVADAGRVADGVALTARRRVGGYVRMVVGDTCPRCVILAGRWYRWSAGFQRHPRCDCVHIPAAEDNGRDWTTDPMEAFRQGRITGLTKAETKAIEEGADISRVVNVKRSGIYTAGGRRLTREASRRRARLTPEQIYRDANGSRDEAIRLLRRFGYIL